MKKIAASLLLVIASVTSGLAQSQTQIEKDNQLLAENQKDTFPNYFQLSRVANNAGMEQLILRNYAEAERNMFEALNLIRKIPRKPIPLHPQFSTGADVAAYQDVVARITFEGTVAHNLGQIFFRQKKYKEAEPMYRISIAAAEANPKKPLLLEYLSDLETLYLTMGNTQLAKEIRSRIQAAEVTR